VSGSPIMIFRSSVLDVAWLGLEDFARFDSEHRVGASAVSRFSGICRVCVHPVVLDRF
jgi:hypothetical protein